MDKFDFGGLQLMRLNDADGHSRSSDLRGNFYLY